VLSFGLGQFTLQIPPWDKRDHAELYRDTLELARLAESVGFSSFWCAEHHGAEDGYIPALLPFLSAVAARTERMQIGTAVLLAPLHNPLRVAEDASVVQNLSGGRLNLGLGLGWVADEYRMFGVPMKGRGRRLEEFVEILRKAGTGERFSFEGRFYSMEDVLVSPTPADPIPIWLGGSTPPALERAARMGDGHFPPSTGSPADAVERAKEIIAIRERLGLTSPYRYGAFLPIGVGADADDGWARIRDGLLHVRGSYVLWAQGRRDVEHARDVAAEWEQQVREGCLTGSPDQIVDALGPHVRELEGLGFSEVFLSAILAPPGTPFDRAAEAVETFGTKVIAALRT
jgi:alkanesulfonate monooxygenase SsuD/methylene tetrahydromethanopterin reductase-like flavin-dependent oxidoreductase (luciferase family)